MRRLIVKFRPSSHSTDLTFVAVYADEADAKRAQRKVGCYRDGKRVIASISSGTPEEADEINDSLERYGPTEMHIYNSYQELEIQIIVPKGVSRETLPLVFDKETHQIIEFLIKNAKKVAVTKKAKTDVWAFEYCGESIFWDENDNPGKYSTNGTITVDGKELSLSKNIRVMEK
jgi:hypothetical protein